MGGSANLSVRLADTSDEKAARGSGFFHESEIMTILRRESLLYQTVNLYS